MIAIRRAEDRRHVRRRNCEVWMTFFTQDGPDPFVRGFGALAMIDEKRMLPGASVRLRSRDDTEMVSYLLEGALACEDSGSRLTSPLKPQEVLSTQIADHLRPRSGTR